MKKIIKLLVFPVLLLNLFFAFNYNVSAEVETNPDAAYDTTTITCGKVQGIPRGITIMSRNFIKVIKVLIPVILIILGIIDMVKAASSNDEKLMKEATNRLIKRIIAAVLVFLVISLIQFVINTLAKAARKSENADVEDTTTSITECISCFISDADFCNPDNYFELACKNFEYKFPLTVDSKEYEYDESKKSIILSDTTDQSIAETCGRK